MPSRPSTKPAAPSESAENDRPDPEQELRALALALSEGQGFRLILATYDLPSVRDVLLDKLRADLETHGVRLTCLDASHRRTAFDLLEALQRHLAASVPPPGDGWRQAVAVVNLESCLDYQHHDPTGTGVLRRANLHREAFADRVPWPVVLWLMPVATSLFAQDAPDLWHWRIATFDFTGGPTEPVEPSLLTRMTSFEEFRGLPLSRQHEGIAVLHDRLRQLEHSAGGRPLAPREEAQRAALFFELGGAHAAMDHREEALRATAKAVEILRALAAERPDFLPHLATSMNNLGSRQSALGRREEALQTTTEAVDICRRLVADRPDAFLPDLADSLNNLGNRQIELGHREKALQLIAEAVEIRRRLAAERPDAFLHHLAQSLTNLGKVQTDLACGNEAVDSAAEGVEIFRRLAAQRPDAFLPNLAQSLTNLGAMLSTLDRREEALDATSEAVEILRRLAAQRPDAFLPDLARNLNNLGIELSNLGRREEGLLASAEAMRLAMPLVRRYPQALGGDFRSYAQNLRQHFEALGQDPDAHPLVREATELLAALDAATAE
jgi:tetratricopeptide (TPR) repeat protein